MTNCTCAFCGRDMEPETVCESDDCPIREVEIHMETVGNIDLPNGRGTDGVVLLTCRNAELTPEQAEQWLLPQVYREGGAPGGYYCHAVSAVQYPGSTIACLAIVHHRYDV